ncbi:hypothetical protein ACFX2I_019019 [Malus domestica]
MIYVRLKDIPSLIKVTDVNGIMFDSLGSELLKLLTKQTKHFPESNLVDSLGSSLWKEDTKWRLQYFTQRIFRGGLGRGYIATCAQDRVQAGPSVGGVFNTGCNSTLETISEGVPVIYWPFFAVQKRNCRYTCTAWEMGVEVSPDVKRDEVEGPDKKILDGEEGMKMRAKAKEWKSVETTDIQGEGSSYNNFKRLIAALQCGK